MPFFTSVETAARIERAECQLLRDEAAAAARTQSATTPVVREIAGGVAVLMESGSPLNKLAGLGFEGVPTEAAFAEVERVFAAAQSDLVVEVSTLGDPEVGLFLTRRGYELVGHEAVLGCPLSPHEAPALPAGLTISRCNDEELKTWVEVLFTGFATPDTQGVASHETFSAEAIEAAANDFSAAAGTVRYLAKRDGVPAGAASMRMNDGIAQLCGSATLPDHRRRGVQTAFLKQRMAVAANAGCVLAIVTTQPGSKSMENVQRRGFELLYVRSILRFVASKS